LNFTQTLKDTYFAEEYYNELFKSYVDNLNLLYVAFTRAVDTLIAFPLFNEKRSIDSQINTTGDLLYECLVRSDQVIEGQFNPENLTFTLGSFQPVISPTKQEARGSNVIYSYATRPATGRMLFNSNGFDYFQGETEFRNRRIRGKVLHELLSKIIKLNDLGKTIQQTVLEGLISKEEGKVLDEHIRSVMTNDTVKSWFDGSGKVLTERDIILPGGHVKRPDRIVLWEKEVQIIDYKFSRGPEERSYRKQVEDYMYLIKVITGKPVRGFLWYVDNNELVEIEKK
jgi:ATP-dependent exoDNAse (exonuclease V) beta subunit